MVASPEDLVVIVDERSHQSTHNVPLNRLNWLNVVAFVFNVVFTYGVGTLGWFGAKSNAELSETYQTLVTPKATAFSIWAVIFLFQAVFTVIQLLPKFRTNPLIQQGVGYYYAWTCLFQATWSLAFGGEVFWLSALFMLAIWASLLAIVYTQYSIPASSMESEYFEFWLLRFPFAIHCGWITAASALNINVLLVDQGTSASVQLAAGIVSLAGLHAVSIWVTLALSKPNYTFATVLSWASWWIHAELQAPNPLIVETFDPQIIQGVSYAAAAVSVIILSQLSLRIFTSSMLLLKRHDEASLAETVPPADALLTCGGEDEYTVTTTDIQVPEK